MRMPAKLDPLMNATKYITSCLNIQSYSFIYSVDSPSFINFQETKGEDTRYGLASTVFLSLISLCLLRTSLES